MIRRTVATAALALAPLALPATPAGAAPNITAGTPDGGRLTCWGTSLEDYGNARWVTVAVNYPASQGRNGELLANGVGNRPAFTFCHSTTGKWYWTPDVHPAWISDRINMPGLYADMAAAQAPLPEAWEQILPVCLSDTSVVAEVGIRSPANAGRYLTINTAGQDSNLGMLSYSAGSPGANSTFLFTNDFLHCRGIIAGPGKAPDGGAWN